MIMSTWIVSMIPHDGLRGRIGRISYVMSLRILVRSISLVATFHDEQYSPKGNGFCVANHTSVIDVAILSSNNCFSLVLDYMHTGNYLRNRLGRTSNCLGMLVTAWESLGITCDISLIVIVAFRVYVK